MEHHAANDPAGAVLGHVHPRRSASCHLSLAGGASRSFLAPGLFTYFVLPSGLKRVKFPIWTQPSVRLALTLTTSCDGWFRAMVGSGIPGKLPCASGNPSERCCPALMN